MPRVQPLAGVMYINIAGFEAIYGKLLAYARSVNWSFYGGTLQDQGLLNVSSRAGGG